MIKKIDFLLIKNMGGCFSYKKKNFKEMEYSYSEPSPSPRNHNNFMYKRKTESNLINEEIANNNLVAL